MAITRLGLNQSLNLASNVTGTLPTANGGTGATSFTSGKLLQVVNSSMTYGQTNTSATYADVESSSGTVWETSITPSATSSKILVQSSLNIYTASSGSTTLQENRFNYKGLYKVGSGSYSAYTTEEYFGFYYYQGAQKAILAPNTLTFSKLITPSTTSALTFKYQFAVYSANDSKVEIGNSKSSTLTLSEIAG